MPRAIGSNKRFALRSILVEGAAKGSVGGALGLIFGMVEQYLSDFASSEVWSVDVYYRPVPLAFALAAGAVIFCIIGSTPPAVQAARANIVSGSATSDGWYEKCRSPVVYRKLSIRMLFGFDRVRWHRMR